MGTRISVVTLFGVIFLQGIQIFFLIYRSLKPPWPTGITATIFSESVDEEESPTQEASASSLASR